MKTVFKLSKAISILLMKWQMCKLLERSLKIQHKMMNMINVINYEASKWEKHFLFVNDVEVSIWVSWNIKRCMWARLYTWVFKQQQWQQQQQDRTKKPKIRLGWKNGWWGVVKNGKRLHLYVKTFVLFQR